MKQKSDKRKTVLQKNDLSTANTYTFSVVALAVVSRLLLNYLGLHSVLERRVEITSPTSSWFRGEMISNFCQV